MNTVDNLEEFIQIDKRIDTAEDQASDSLREGIRDRWEFGRLMLAERKGKQLPKGMMAELIEATGKGETELQFRMRFAERYPSEDEVRTAIRTFTSWTQIKKNLPKSPPPGQPKPSKPPKPSPSKDPELIKNIVTDIDRGDDVSELALTARYGTTARVAIDARNFARGVIEGRSSAEATVIDWDMQSAKVKDREAVLRRVIRRELEAEFEPRVQDEVRSRVETENRLARQMRDDARRVLDARKGIFTRADYDLIRSCLHPDSRLSATDDKLAKAFRLFNEAELLFLNEKDFPTTTSLPSMEDLMKRRRRPR